MSFTVTAVAPDGTERDLGYRGHQWMREFGKKDMVRVWVARDDVSDAALEEEEDEIYIEHSGDEATAAGLLTDVQGGSSVVELVVDSFETYANETEPVSPTRRENSDDSDLVTEGLSFVDELSAGTVETIDTSVSFVFSYISPAKWLRTVEENCDGELLYRSNKTVDYIARIGEDKSGSITVSPGNQNIDGDIRVITNTRGTNTTHMKMLGPGEGNHQVVVNVVPDSDTTSYNNKVTYENPDWEPGDRKRWDDFTNVEATSVESLSSSGLSLMKEMRERRVEVEVTIKDESVSIGDTIHIEKPEDRLSDDLRVVEWERIHDKDGLRYDCKLSNQKKARDTRGEKLRKDVERHNKAFRGSPVMPTASGGRQPVDDSPNKRYEFGFYWPDEIEYEHRVKLQVRSLAYRAYSQGAANGGGTFVSTTTGVDGAVSQTTGIDGAISQSSDDGGGFSVVESSNANSEHGIVDQQSDTGFTFVDGSWESVAFFSPPSSEAVLFHVFATNTSSVNEVRARVRAGGSYYPSSSGIFIASTSDNPVDDVFFDTENYSTITVGGSGAGHISIPSDELWYRLEVWAGGANVAWAAQAWGTHVHNVPIDRPDHSHQIDVSGHDHQIDISGHSHSFDVDIPNHTHQPEPGLMEFTEYPSNCDVVVNGNSIGTSLFDGSGEDTETVDLRGELNPGQWNRIEITSDTLGHLQAHLDADVYRQILGDG